MNPIDMDVVVLRAGERFKKLLEDALDGDLPRFDVPHPGSFETLQSIALCAALAEETNKRFEALAGWTK
jgi:hypothetical protein